MKVRSQRQEEACFIISLPAYLSGKTHDNKICVSCCHYQPLSAQNPPDMGTHLELLSLPKLWSKSQPFFILKSPLGLHQDPFVVCHSEDKNGTYRSATNSRQNKQEAEGNYQEDNNDNDGIDIKHKGLPRLRVEGEDSIKERHPGAEHLQDRDSLWAKEFMEAPSCLAAIFVVIAIPSSRHTTVTLEALEFCRALGLGRMGNRCPCILTWLVCTRCWRREEHRQHCEDHNWGMLGDCIERPHNDKHHKLSYHFNYTSPGQLPIAVCKDLSWRSLKRQVVCWQKWCNHHEVSLPAHQSKAEWF